MDLYNTALCECHSEAFSPVSAIGAIPAINAVGTQDDICEMYTLGFLDALLADRTTGRHIIWATETYSKYGPAYGHKQEMSEGRILGLRPSLRQIRANKRAERTRRHGEVFTPLWVCEKMCDHAHKVLRGKDWKKYVTATVLEITCGEAPFLVSRHDLANGAFVPVQQRVGLLDRKLKVINEKVQNRDEWLQWVFRAFQATYGYEFQGDNLLIARINMLRTFEEYIFDRWAVRPSPEDYRRILNIITWNIWQMDGLTGTIPFGKIKQKHQALSLFDPPANDENICQPCVIYDWETGKPIEFLRLNKAR